MARYEIRVSGFGGQGVITLSKMIIMASSIYEGYAATQTEAYSAAARGGKCWAEVVVDIDKNVELIDYPKALKPYDFLIVLSEESANDIKVDFVKDEQNTGFLVWDPSTIKKFKAAKKINKVLGIPVQKLAVEKFGNIVFGNSILFGIFTILSGIFSEESALETLKKFVPNTTLDKNLEAFELGKQEAMNFLTKLKEENN
ncbi:MAG: 2-oxoacid:acceptor oxidoreductase family protein [Candidatus Lokiarchaeota archaeon]|nr:2-oxoacid:acceptor oxidoreductase family protein [Candidatus Lokiarchaeota archaeon]